MTSRTERASKRASERAATWFSGSPSCHRLKYGAASCGVSLRIALAVAAALVVGACLAAGLACAPAVVVVVVGRCCGCDGRAFKRLIFKMSSTATTSTATATTTTSATNKHVQSVYYLQLKLCKDILDALCDHECAFLFRQPVDVIGLGLTDYHTIIKSPMDFSTVRVRVPLRFALRARGARIAPSF